MTPPIICFEIIDKGPPCEEKLPKLLKFSKEKGALIILGIVTHKEPDQNDRYFKVSAQYKSVSTSYYIWNGELYRNGEKAQWLKDGRKLHKEIEICQKKMEYIPNFL